MKHAKKYRLNTFDYEGHNPSVNSYERRFNSFYYVHATRKSCRNDVRMKNLYIKRWWNWPLDKHGRKKSVSFMGMGPVLRVCKKNIRNKKLCIELVSISSTFYASIFCPKFWRQKFTKPNKSREKLLNLVSYKKQACKTLIKWTAASSYKV